MKRRLSLFSRWWISGTLVVLTITVISEPELFLGNMQTACTSNVLLGMLGCVTGLLAVSFLLFMLANHNGNRIFWGASCFALAILMIWGILETNADIFYILALVSALGVAFAIDDCPSLFRRKEAS